MAADPDLVRRSGDLKRDLVAFAQRPRFTGAFRQLHRKHLGSRLAVDEADAATMLDYFILQHRQADGRTVLDHFLQAHPELSEAEREMLRGWHDVVEGVFAVQRRDGDALVVLNLVDDLTYRIHSNMGPRVFRQTPPGSFLIGRLVPVGDEWLVSGFLHMLPASQRAEARRMAVDLSLQRPSLPFRNPAKLEQAWRLQREEREQFIAFFGSDLIVLPGRDVADRIRAFYQYRMREVQDTEGRTAADRARQADGKAPPVPEMDLPRDLRDAETVGVIYDEIDGMNFLNDFGIVAEAFANPALADKRHREVVQTYLEDDSISPRLLQRLAEEDPRRASELFRRVLREPRFAWEQDGEALLRRYKAEYFAHPVLPGVAPMGEALSQLPIDSAPAGDPVPSTPGRNDPCPCGSGKKYKQCCGR